MVDVIDVLSTLFMIIKYTDIEMPIPTVNSISGYQPSLGRLIGERRLNITRYVYRHLADKSCSHWPNEVALGGQTMTQRLNIKISARLSRCILFFYYKL